MKKQKEHLLWFHFTQRTTFLKLFSGVCYGFIFLINKEIILSALLQRRRTKTSLSLPGPRLDTLHVFGPCYISLKKWPLKRQRAFTQITQLPIEWDRRGKGSHVHEEVFNIYPQNKEDRHFWIFFFWVNLINIWVHNSVRLMRNRILVCLFVSNFLFFSLNSCSSAAHPAPAKLYYVKNKGKRMFLCPYVIIRFHLLLSRRCFSHHAKAIGNSCLLACIPIRLDSWPGIFYFTRLCK